jgi:DNA-binding response OmpR family regulator
MARILIIVDDPSVRTLLSEVFSGMEQKHLVTTAPDGLRGIESARLNIPDVIITDVDMPGLNGYDVCARLRADPATRLIPILMLTGTTNLEGAIKGIGLGADDHISKPFNVDEVAARVQALLLRAH